MMDPNLMRLAWLAIDETPSPCGQKLPLSDRINSVIKSVEDRSVLSTQQRQEIQQYLTDRQHLITDLYQ